jgi:putative heme-binding domain-containing protein
MAVMAKLSRFWGMWLAAAAAVAACLVVPLATAVEKRTPWTASTVRGSPDPPPPLKTRLAYPHLKFDHPTAIVAGPGGRLFVTEESGRVWSFPDDPECRAADPVIDVSDLVARLQRRMGRGPDKPLALVGLYGIAFHPDFATNRQCWDKDQPIVQDGARVVRLTVLPGDPPRCDPESEVVVLTWRPGGHQGGCVAFGPDGHLYISTGDAAAPVPPDSHKTGQDVSDLLASILRIDVNRSEGDRPYAIPPDNPLVKFENARGEIWAYGLRNPWKFSFDRQTGELWTGDVGFEMREWIDKVKPGDNFGWSVKDGSEPLHTDWPVGPTPVVPPTIELTHADAASITGGHVYRGSRLPELEGKYVFGDWETRRIWAVDAQRPDLAGIRDIVEPTLRVVAFGEREDGELLVLDYDDGTIHEFVRNDATQARAPFPDTLAKTGLFADVATLAPMPGVVPFAIQAEAWADHATAVRHVAVPGDAAIGLYAKPQPIAGSQFSRMLHFPADTVLAKTISMEMERGRPETARRIETQILHFDGRSWRGYTYAWNDAQTDAQLVPSAGKRIDLTVADSEAPEGVRHQQWVFHSRAECVRCHNPWAENTLAFNVPQINREISRGGTVENQLARFRRIGLVKDEPLPADPADGPFGKEQWPGPEDALPRLADPRDATASIEDRGRSYLHVNCGHCHRFGGGGSNSAWLNHELALTGMEAIGVRPRLGGFGIEDAHIVAPGDPYRSALYYRMATPGSGRMPHIGSSVVDAEGLAVIHDWIIGLTPWFAEEQTVKKLLALDADAALVAERGDALRQRWRIARARAARAGRVDPNDDDFAAADRALAAGADARRKALAKERLELIKKGLESTSAAVMFSRALLEGRLPPVMRAEVIAAARQHPDPVTAALFEAHVPPADRVRRLGTDIDPAEVLSLAGDAGRGRTLFRESSAAQCRTCHVAEEVGRELGPSFADIAARLDRGQILEAILHPSKKIDPQYRSWLAQLADGRVVTGLLVERNESRIVLRDAEGKAQEFAAGDVDELDPSPMSLMPEHQFRDLTAGQAADMLAYLESLRRPAATVGTRGIDLRSVTK